MANCISTVLVFSLLVSSCYCFLPNLSDVTGSNQWSPAVATWYGPPTGAGSDGGACGYGQAVEKPPFSQMISAGGPSLYQNGQGCGACYQVKCTSNAACSGNPVRVVITDSCPGCSGAVHFDLSGHAIRAMAKPGQEQQLENAGVVPIDYQRVPCVYPGASLAFLVQPGASVFSFATLVMYESGDGDLAKVELQQQGDSQWHPMRDDFGAVWKLDVSGSPLKPPLSLRLTTRESGKVIVATNVIPVGFQPNAVYICKNC